MLKIAVICGGLRHGIYPWAVMASQNFMSCTGGSLGIWQSTCIVADNRSGPKRKEVALIPDAKLLRHECLLRIQVYSMNGLLKNDQLLEKTGVLDVTESLKISNQGNV
ncbi:hypothetical protein NE237_027356 [Protea cynaroides]|uniref:Uncharacterized protein n=1 Tax=Protea cynaroides TaxID=273540 RepID=A0A9Q0JRU4_9MAGN|nr:hypothetical protein NE237_027356 [Protea cynaroides]